MSSPMLFPESTMLGVVSFKTWWNKNNNFGAFSTERAR